MWALCEFSAHRHTVSGTVRSLCIVLFVYVKYVSDFPVLVKLEIRVHFEQDGNLPVQSIVFVIGHWAIIIHWGGKGVFPLFVPEFKTDEIPK